MPTITQNDLELGDVREWRLILPVCHLQIIFQTVGTVKTIIDVKNFGADTSWDLTPIVRTQDDGNPRIVAWKFTGKFEIPESDWETLTPQLDAIANLKVDYAKLYLAYQSKFVNQTDPSEMLLIILGYYPTSSSLSVIPKFSQSDKTPKLSLEMLGIFSKDAIKTAMQTFFEIDWSSPTWTD